MSDVTWIQTNFNAGEWSPMAQGRVDHAKYKNGLDSCQRFIPTQQGGLTRCPGTRFVAAAKDQTQAPRLRRFVFNQAQSYILEFGEGYIRFFVNGGQLEVSSVAAYSGVTDYVPGDLVEESGVNYYCIAASTGDTPPDTDFWYPLTGDIFEIPNPYSHAEVWTLEFEQSGDVLYIACPTKHPRKLKRLGATNWVLEEVPFRDGPYLSTNVTTTTLTPDSSVVPEGSTTNAWDGSTPVTVVASSTVGINNDAGFRASDVGRYLRIKMSGVWLAGKITEVTDTTHVEWSPSKVIGSQIPRTATAKAYVTAGGVYGITVLDGGGGYGISPPSVTFGAVGATAVAKASASLTSGVVTAVTIQDTGAGYGSVPTVTLSAPQNIDPAATTFWRLGLWNDTDGYPAAVTFYQSRLCWAGAGGQPDRVDMSNTGDYENMAPTEVDGTVIASNALAFAMGYGAVDGIRWILGDEQGLLIGTAGGEWVMTPSGGQQALTASNVYLRQMSNFGSSASAPIRLGRSVMFIQRTARKLRELFYEFTYNTFRVIELSIVSEQLTKSGLKRMAVQLVPQQLIWAHRNDGALSGVTFDKEEQTLGWHDHPLGGTDALVESVDVIASPDGSRDELWLATSRTINGSTVRYIERMAKVWENGDALEDAVFLDCSGEYSGAGTATITGLTWLVGETVGVLLNGAVYPDQVVNSSGEISVGSLGQFATTLKVQVGLRYSSHFRSLRIEAGGDNGPAQGKTKRVRSVLMRLFQTLGIKVRSSNESGGYNVVPFRAPGDSMNAPPPLFTGDRREAYEARWDTDGYVDLLIDDPLPCNITMLTARVETKD